MAAAIGLPGAVAGGAGRLPRGREWRWGIDYGAATDPAVARQYRLLVLEPDHPRAIAPLRGPGSVMLGYLSLGEIERSRASVATLAAAGALKAANPDWPDARMIDLRHPAWRAEVIDTLIPAIVAKGYDGVFLDTLDIAEAMERADPVANAGMIAAAGRLVAAMRAAFPALPIVMNRGYALLPDSAEMVDGVLGEAMATRWSFADRRYERLSDADWSWQADRLRAACARNAALVPMTLDYWDPADSVTVAALYARQRAAGFVPYVSTLALDRLLPEPVR